jgi:ABC-2 type transport system permease protein
VAILVRKLLRDVWLALAVVALLLAAFECLWAKVTQRVIGELVPVFSRVASLGGQNPHLLEETLFKGPGKIIRTLMGGERLDLDNAMDMLSIGYVHPLVQVILCVWAVGRAAGAIAGELDRGTMELLMAQPLPRYRLVLAHFCVDLVTIPVLCLSLWAGTWLGTWLVGPIQVAELPAPPAKSAYLVELGPFKVRLEPPDGQGGGPPKKSVEDRLRWTPAAFGPALWVVGGLLFALSGSTMYLSAAGRFRWRVLGLAVLLTLVQFLINVIAQMWDALAPLRPLTIFYYYQPQQVVLAHSWAVDLREWNGGEPLCRVPVLAVLYGMGLIGYALAWRTFGRRDLPAPL